MAQKRFKILALNKDVGGAKAIAPVIIRLKEESIFEVAVIGYELSKEVFKNNGIDFNTPEKYCSNYEDSAHKILDQEMPHIILMGTTDGKCIEKDMILIAKKRNIKTISVLDACYNYLRRFSSIPTRTLLSYNAGDSFEEVPEKEKEKILNNLPDFITVTDEIAKEDMIKEGFPKQKIIVTGNPNSDYLFKNKDINNNDISAIKTKIGIKPDCFLVTFASEPNSLDYGFDETSPNYLGYTEKEVLLHLIKALENIQVDYDRKITLLVRPHPIESIDYLDSLNEGKKIDIVLDRSIPLEKVIKASDIVCGMRSGVLLEAAYSKKISISIQPNLKKKDTMVGNRTGITLPVYDSQKLEPLLRRIVFDQDYCIKIIKELEKKTNLDGKSTERVVDLIKKMLGAQKIDLI